jgi:hypothetical protein
MSGRTLQPRESHFSRDGLLGQRRIPVGFLAGFLVVLAFIVLVEVGVSALFALIAIVLGAIYVSGKRRTTMKKENGR